MKYHKLIYYFARNLRDLVGNLSASIDYARNEIIVKALIRACEYPRKQLAASWKYYGEMRLAHTSSAFRDCGTALVKEAVIAARRAPAATKLSIVHMRSRRRGIIVATRWSTSRAVRAHLHFLHIKICDNLTFVAAIRPVLRFIHRVIKLSRASYRMLAAIKALEKPEAACA